MNTHRNQLMSSIQIGTVQLLASAEVGDLRDDQLQRWKEFLETFLLSVGISHELIGLPSREEIARQWRE